MKTATEQTPDQDWQAAKTKFINSLIKRLRRYNKWRRGAEITQPSPLVIGQDIDMATELLEAMNDRIRIMSDAIRLTIAENRHLADGKDCTLRHLVRVHNQAPNNDDKG